MVYKIRNKGFDIFSAATSTRVHPAKKTKIGLDLTRLVTLQVQQTRFTGMRIKHGYRNISRSCKQFLMGDRLLEQCCILQLKWHFFRPMHYQSPIENSFYIVSFRLFYNSYFSCYFRVVPSLIWLTVITPSSPIINIHSSFKCMKNITSSFVYLTQRLTRLDLLILKHVWKKWLKRELNNWITKKERPSVGMTIKISTAKSREKRELNITSNSIPRISLVTSQTTLKSEDHSVLLPNELSKVNEIY